MTFIDMPKHSRIWIYQCNRMLSKDEISFIKNSLNAFLTNWDTHGEKMKAAADVFYDRFVVFFADEKVTSASGCSIDRKVALMKSFGEKFDVDFFDRTIVTYKNGDEIVQKKMNDFWAMRKANIITDDSLVFNNLINTKEEFESKWIVPFKESWHAEMW